jgi:hypothetical protein
VDSSTVPPASGKPVEACLVTLADVIQIPGGHAAKVTSKEQAEGESAPVLLGYTDLKTGRNGYITFAPSEAVVVLRDSPARAA